MSNNNDNGIGEWIEYSRLILSELDRLSEEQQKMTVILNENTESLKQHMEQTAAVKEIARAALEKNDLLRKEVEAKIAPIQDHVTFVKNIVSFGTKVVIIVIGASGFIYTCFEIYDFLKNGIIR